MSSDPDFVPNIRDISVLPRDSITISIIFSPSNQVSYNDSLIILSNDPSQPQVIVHLSGEGFGVEQVLPVAQGLNLISLYVHPEDMSPGSIFAPMSCLEQVKSMTESYDPDLPDFLNTLEFLTDVSGYFVNASCAEDVSIIGQPVDGTVITIDLSVGWNLIGYPFDMPTDVDVAFASIIGAGCLEQVKSMTESYDPDLPDFLNTLETLEPGKGYFINVSCDVSFEYPAPVAAMLKSATAGSIQSPWSTRMYTQSMVHYGKVTLDGMPINGEAFVGAFVNNECRGQDAVRSAGGETYTTLVINGEEVEDVIFKLFHEGKVYTSKTLAVNNPGEVTRELSSIEFGTENNISIFPNPVEENLTIEYNLNSHSQVNITILDMLGRTVYNYQEMNDAGSYSIVLEDVKANYNMTRGTYILKFSIDESFSTHKILIQ